MNLEDFKQLYEECGDVVAKLCISDLEAAVDEVAVEFPAALRLLSITPYAWANLLIVHPEVFTYCNTSNFDGHCWAWLLAAQPLFDSVCAWDKLDGGDWYFVLVSQPSLIPRFNQLSTEKREQLMHENSFIKDLIVELT
jgi:hypothetical protein